MNYEMESATLLTMCASQGCVPGWSPGYRQPYPAGNSERGNHEANRKPRGKIVVEAARRLL